MTKPNSPPTFAAKTNTADKVPRTLQTTQKRTMNEWNRTPSQRLRQLWYALVVTNFNGENRNANDTGATNIAAQDPRRVQVEHILSKYDQQQAYLWHRVEQKQIIKRKTLRGITIGRHATDWVRTIWGMASSSRGNFRPNLSTIHKNDIFPTKPPTANIEATIDASSLVSGPLGRRVSLVCKMRKFDGAHTIDSPNESPNTFATTRGIETVFELEISPLILDARCTLHSTYHRTLPKTVVESRSFPFRIRLFYFRCTRASIHHFTVCKSAASYWIECERFHLATPRFTMMISGEGNPYVMCCMITCTLFASPRRHILSNFIIFIIFVGVHRFASYSHPKYRKLLRVRACVCLQLALWVWVNDVMNANETSGWIRRLHDTRTFCNRIKSVANAPYVRSFASQIWNNNNEMRAGYKWMRDTFRVRFRLNLYCVRAFAVIMRKVC